MDQIDVATFTTAVLILVFFFQALTLWSPQHEQGAVKKPRRLRPRTPEDCPFCGDEHDIHAIPWCVSDDNRSPTRSAEVGEAGPRKNRPRDIAVGIWDVSTMGFATAISMP